MFTIRISSLKSLVLTLVMICSDCKHRVYLVMYRNQTNDLSDVILIVNIRVYLAMCRNQTNDFSDDILIVNIEYT
jgi:hypothetical protein